MHHRISIKDSRFSFQEFKQVVDHVCERIQSKALDYKFDLELDNGSFTLASIANDTNSMHTHEPINGPEENIKNILTQYSNLRINRVEYVLRGSNIFIKDYIRITFTLCPDSLSVGYYISLSDKKDPLIQELSFFIDAEIRKLEVMSEKIQTQHLNSPSDWMIAGSAGLFDIAATHGSLYIIQGISAILIAIVTLGSTQAYKEYKYHTTKKDYIPLNA